MKIIVVLVVLLVASWDSDALPTGVSGEDGSAAAHGVSDHPAAKAEPHKAAAGRTHKVAHHGNLASSVWKTLGGTHSKPPQLEKGHLLRLPQHSHPSGAEFRRSFEQLDEFAEEYASDAAPSKVECLDCERADPKSRAYIVDDEAWRRKHESKTHRERRKFEAKAKKKNKLVHLSPTSMSGDDNDWIYMGRKPPSRLNKPSKKRPHYPHVCYATNFANAKQHWTGLCKSCIGFDNKCSKQYCYGPWEAAALGKHGQYMKHDCRIQTWKTPSGRPALSKTTSAE